MSSTASSTEEMTLEYLHSIIPKNYDTVVTSFTPGTEDRKFLCTLRINIFEMKDVSKWLEEFERKSSTIWRVARSYGIDTVRNKFKKMYHCFHTTKRKRSSVPLDEQVACQAQLTIILKQPGKQRSQDPYYTTHPCILHLKSLHNHDIDGPAVLKYRIPSEKVQNIFRELFSKGHLPTSALQYYKTTLEEQISDPIISESKDQELCPSLRWVYSFHHKLFKVEHCRPDEKEIDILEKIINDYNKQCRDRCAALCKKDDMLTIAICSPLMKRVHQLLDTCHEIVFIDSSKSLDRHNSRVYIMLSPTFLGALPLGLFIVYSMSSEAIIKGLKLLQTIFPESPFCGMQSPQVIITEDCSILRHSMSVVFPNASLYLSKFHVLQSVMKCLWFDKNNVTLSDRKLLYNLFRYVYHSNSAEQMQERFQELLNASAEYTAVKDYFSTLEKHICEWALYQYSMYHIYQYDSNDYYCKATFRVLSDKVCKMLKAFNVIHLFQFFTTKLNEMYRNKIINYMNSRVKISKRENFFCTTRIAEKFEIKRIEKFLFEVSDLRKYQIHFIDTDIICCTCPIGLQGLLCKHHHAIVKEHNLISYTFSMKCLAMIQKGKFLEIAVGIDPDSDGEKGDDNVDLSPDVESESHFSPSNDVSDDENNGESGSILCYPIIGENIVEVVLKQANAYEDDIANCQEKLTKVFDDIKQRLNDQPHQFCTPINEFVKSYHECKTDAALAKALIFFGTCEVIHPVEKDNLAQGRTNPSSPSFEIVKIEANYNKF